MSSENSNPELRAELADLRARLAEAEETVRAIRSGEADALVIASNQGDEVHLLGEGDRIYRQFIETVSEGTATLSATGNILSCNAALAKTLRRPLDQVLGSALRDHLSPDDGEAFAAILAQTGPGSRRKIRLKTSEGSLVPVYLSASLLHSAGAEPVSCLVFTDLEEVISAEQTLREGEEHFRATFEQAAVGIAHVTPDGRWLLVNQKLCDIVGYTREELLAKSFLDITHPDDLETDLTGVRQMLAGEIIVGSTEKRYIRKDTSIVWVNLTVSLVRKPSGAPSYFIAVVEDITERKRAEKALQESEERHRTLLQTAMDGFWMVDTQGRLLEVNEAYCRMSGYGEQELLAMRIPDLEVIESADETAARIRKVVTQGESRFESRHRRKDGSLFDVEVSVQYRSADGGRMAAFLRDITERKRAEDALRASQQLIEKIINAIPARVFWKDKNLVYLGCNAAFARDAGFADPEDVVGKDDFQMGWSDQADLYRNDDRQVIESGDSKFLIEEPSTTPEGKTITLLTSKLPLRNSKGEISGVLGTYIDITERKRAEADRERLTVAIEEAGEPVMITDARGTIQYVNPVFETVTGYSRAEVVGKSSRILKSGEHDKAHFREVLDTITSGRVWRGRLVNSRKDGSLFIVDTTISPVHDEAGRIVSYVGVERDITELLRLAEEKVKIEDQLRQAQKVEAIGRLAGGVAHDFNNLTAIVIGYGEMLLGRLCADEPARKWAEQIVAAGKRSATLTRQLLAFSRRQVLLPVVLDLNDLLRNLEKMLARLIGEDIALTFDLAGDLGRITADPGQIEQVVTNLVINARDAMPRGGRLAVMTANVQLDETFAGEHVSVVPGEYVRLTLTDTGCGMDKATLGRLFEPFFTTKEKGRGTGLGLATAFGFVKQSGGYLYAYSEPGVGTTFKIYLPRTDAEPQAPAIEPREETPRGDGELVLLVEDEASLRELCAIILSRLGYRVSTSGSGSEALAQVAEKGLEPELVVTDVIMPGMSGAEMAEQLRRDRPGLKVLYMSGYPDEAITRHGVLGPGISFLQKPFSERDLAVKVRDVLGVKAAAAQPVRRVLMIDDDEQFRDLVRHFCAKRGHVFAGVDSSAAALAALAGHSFDVLLVDLNIPGTSGERILREIRAAGHATPAIVLTGDVASADMDLLRPLGVVRVLQKSSAAEPLLQAIEAAAHGAPPAVAAGG